MIKGNGNLLERIFSPFQLIEDPLLQKLRQLATETLSKKCFQHYRGFLTGCQREHQLKSEPTIKTMLYCYRVALTGVHLLQTGLVEANLRRLAPLYEHDNILELCDKKCSTQELVLLTPEEDRHFKKGWQSLEQALSEACEQSHLPASAPNITELSNWLQSWRLSRKNS